MDFDSILRVLPEQFYGQVPLDPFEEGFYLPSVAIDVGYDKWSKFKIIGNKGYSLILFSIVELNKAQVFRVLLLADIANEVV